jgi:hypothetical protein
LLWLVIATSLLTILLKSQTPPNQQIASRFVRRADFEPLAAIIFGSGADVGADAGADLEAALKSLGNSEPPDASNALTSPKAPVSPETPSPAKASDSKDGLPEGTIDTLNDSANFISSNTPLGYKSIVVIALSFANCAISEFSR